MFVIILTVCCYHTSGVFVIIQAVCFLSNKWCVCYQINQCLGSGTIIAQDPDPELTGPDPELTDPDPVLMDPDSELTDPDPELTDPDPVLTDPDSELTDPDPELTDPDPELTDPDPECTDRKLWAGHIIN